MYNDGYYYTDNPSSSSSSSSSNNGQNGGPIFTRHRLLLPAHQTRHGWPWPTALNDNDINNHDNNDNGGNTYMSNIDPTEVNKINDSLLKTNDTTATDTTSAIENNTKIMKLAKIKSNQDPLTPSSTESHYDNWLLTLAIDLGERLLPAFHTNTGRCMYIFYYEYLCIFMCLCVCMCMCPCMCLCMCMTTIIAHYKHT